MISRSAIVNFFRAIKLNDIEKVCKIMQKNPEILKLSNTAGKGKYTPLWEAMIRGHSEIVEIFMQFGADPDEKCNVVQNEIRAAKYTFLHYMASCEFSLSNFKVAEVLLRHGAKVNALVRIEPLIVEVFPYQITTSNLFRNRKPSSDC